MSLTELLPSLQALSPADKRIVLEFLAKELSKEGEFPPFMEGASYPIWTPFHVYEAAAVLQRLLDEGKTSSSNIRVL